MAASGLLARIPRRAAVPAHRARGSAAMSPRALVHRAVGRARSTVRYPDRGSHPTASLPEAMGSCASRTIRVRVAQERNSGAHPDIRRFRRKRFRETTKRVLTFWHAGCTFIVSQTRTGAIPEAESQQNADGLDASLDCRRSALREHHVGCRHTFAGRTISIQKTQRRGAPHRTTSSLATPTHSDSHQSACAHPVELEPAVNEVAAGGPFGAVVRRLQPGQFTRIHETGIDIWARRVYVHCTPEADGSNLESGRSAERRRVWGQTWSCRRSALSRCSRAGISAPAISGIPRFPHTWLIGAGDARADV